MERVAGGLLEIAPKRVAFVLNPDPRNPKLFPFGGKNAVYSIPILLFGSFALKIPILNKRWQRFHPDFDATLDHQCKELGITNSIGSRKKKFLSQFISGCLLFRLTKPKSIVVINSACFAGFICAAKKYDIPVFEIQHGVINRYHFNYFYKQVLENPTFPDEFIFWGSYFEKGLKDSTMFSTGQCKAITGGYFALDQARMKRVKSQTRTPCVVFSGQEGIYEDNMIDFLESIAGNERFRMLRTIYIPRVFKKSIAARLNNLDIECDETTDLYSAFQQATHHISIFSTTIYESLGFNLKTACLKDNTNNAADYFGDLIADGTIGVIQTPSCFFEWALEQKNHSTSQTDYFFGSELTHHYQRIIDA